MLKKIHMQFVLLYLYYLRRNSLLKCVSQPETAKKSIKPLFWCSRLSKVIDFGVNRKPEYDFLLVINSNLIPISIACFWDMATYWLKIANFPPPRSHLALSLGGDFFEFMGKLYGSWNKSLPGSRWWQFGDFSLHRFWLIHPCDRLTDRIAMAKTRYSSICFRA